MLVCEISVLEKFGMELLDRELLDLGLNWQEMVAILVLDQVPGAEQAFLGQFLQRDKGNVSRTLSGLEARGLVVRKGHPEDRRRKILVLEEKGKVLAPLLREIMGAWEEKVLGCLSARERKLYEELNGKVTRGILDQSGGLVSREKDKGKGGSKA